MADGAKREPAANAAESKTLCMRGNSMRENRETSQTPYSEGCKGRPEKAFSRAFQTPIIHRRELPEQCV